MAHPSHAALVGRWRRLEAAVAEARAAGNPLLSDPSLQDAAARALHEIYDLWEIWSEVAGHRAAKQQTPESENDAVRGDPDGETAAALAFARGNKSHDFVEFGEPLGFGMSPFGTGPFGVPAWYWQPYTGTRTHARSKWYADHVAGHPVLPRLEAAVRWLRTQPHLEIPPA